MFKKIWNIVSIVFVLVVVALAVLLAGVRLIGLKPFVVTSGSMVPAYPVGALIYVTETEPENVRTGDAITFYMEDGSAIATHRVVFIDTEGECFQTKGDANEAPDGVPVAFGHLIGVPVLSIPMLGYISNFVSTPPGSYIAVCAALAVLLQAFIPGLLKKSAKRNKERLDNAQLKPVRMADATLIKGSVKPKRLYNIRKLEEHK